MPVNLIVAMTSNRVIGFNNKIPWHLPADFAWFKKQTLGHPIIMGRKTFESIGKPLPGRRNIVISRNAQWRAEGCEVFTTLEAALGSSIPIEQKFVIGGASLYGEALPLADCLYVTEIDALPEGDTFFPELNSHQWRESWREHHPADDKNAHAMDFVILHRQKESR